MSPNRKIRTDLIGTKVGMLTLNKIVGQTKARNYLWECTCDCGNTVIRGQQALLQGRFSSCGCHMKTYLTPGDSERCSKAGIARAKKRNVNGCNIDMSLREGTIKTNTSGVQGVCWASNVCKWHVYVGYQSYRCNLGYYDDLNLAKEVREMANQHIKDGTFEDFFYSIRGFRIEDKLSKLKKQKEGKYWPETHIDRR